MANQPSGDGLQRGSIDVDALRQFLESIGSAVGTELLREEHRQVIADRLGRAAGNGHRILQHLYEHPIVSAKEVQDVIGTTFAAANQIVHRLADIGVLSEITGQARHRRFRYEPYVRLFEDDRS